MQESKTARQHYAREQESIMKKSSKMRKLSEEIRKHYAKEQESKTALCERAREHCAREQQDEKKN